MEYRPTLLVSQPYFSLFPVGGVKGREKYVWTLWPAFRATKECNNNCVQRLQITRLVCELKHLSSQVLLFCEACAHTGKLSRQRAHSEQSCQHMLKKESSQEWTWSAISPTGRVATATASSDLRIQEQVVLMLFLHSRGPVKLVESKAQSKVTRYRRTPLRASSIRISMQEVMCSIQNRPIRFEPHALVRMSTESWPECSDVFFSPSRSSHRK